MKTITQLTSLAFCTTFLFGCLGSNGSNVSSSLKMQLANNTTSLKASGAYSAATSPLTFGDDATTFTITDARMNIRDIRFDTSNVDGVVGTTQTITGPYVMDLLSGTSLPNDIVFDLPTGNYQRVDIRLDESNIGDGLVAADDALLGKALIISGTHDYNGVVDGTFTMTVQISEDIRFEPTNGFAVDTETGANVTLTYKVTDWLEDANNPGTKIDLSSCILANGLMDNTNHISLTEGTQCAGITESIGNIIKDNMKNKYDMSNG